VFSVVKTLLVAARPPYTTTLHLLVFFDRLFFLIFLSYLLSIIYTANMTAPTFHVFITFFAFNLSSFNDFVIK